MKSIILVLLVAFVFAFGCTGKSVTAEEAKDIAEIEAQKLGIDAGLSGERRDVAVDVFIGGGYTNYGFVVNETYECKRIVRVSSNDGGVGVLWECTPQGKDRPRYYLKET